MGEDREEEDHPRVGDVYAWVGSVIPSPSPELILVVGVEGRWVRAVRMFFIHPPPVPKLQDLLVKDFTEEARVWSYLRIREREEV